MSDYTEHYQLHQWQPQDRFLRTDFNQDLQKIDTALDSLADKSSALEAAVALCGNCILHYSTYVGTGSGKTELTFPGKPMLVNVMGTNIWMVSIQGVDMGISKNAGVGGGWQDVVWTGNTVTFESNSSDMTAQCNNKGETYTVVCFMMADE